MQEKGQGYFELRPLEVRLVGLRAALRAKDAELLQVMDRALEVAERDGGVTVEKRYVDRVIELAQEHLIDAPDPNGISPSGTAIFAESIARGMIRTFEHPEDNRPNLP